jgi:hypothetical protein
MHVVFFQDFLEELKLVVRGSLFQVASLQDCFLQQSEPLAATSTGMGSHGQFAHYHQPRQMPRSLSGLGPITQRGLSSEPPPPPHTHRMHLQKSWCYAKCRARNLFLILLYNSHEFELTNSGIVSIILLDELAKLPQIKYSYPRLFNYLVLMILWGVIWLGLSLAKFS